MTETVPNSCRSSALGSSTFVFFWDTSRIIRFSDNAWSTALAARSRFTNNGTIMYGKTTISASGSTGSRSGILTCCCSEACSAFTSSMLITYMLIRLGSTREGKWDWRGVGRQLPSRLRAPIQELRPWNPDDPTVGAVYDRPGCRRSRSRAVIDRAYSIGMLLTSGFDARFGRRMHKTPSLSSARARW